MVGTTAIFLYHENLVLHKASGHCPRTAAERQSLLRRALVWEELRMTPMTLSTIPFKHPILLGEGHFANDLLGSRKMAGGSLSTSAMLDDVDL